MKELLHKNKTGFLWILLISLFFNLHLVAQPFSISITPSVQCLNNVGNTTTTVSITNTVSGATSYSWSASTSTACVITVTTTAPNGSVASISYPCCGSYTLVCTAYNGTSSISTSTSVATIICGPTISISGSGSVCAASPGTLAASGALTYTWNTSANSNQIIVSPTVNTCYTVSGINASGCVSQSSVCISVVPQDSAGFIYSVNANGNVTFTSISTPTTALSSYTWNFGNGSSTITSNPLNTATTNYTSNGAYTTTLFFTSGMGCPGISTATALINVNTFSCSVSANFNGIQGSNGLVNFTNISTGTVASTSYTWNFGDNVFNYSPSPAHTYSANGNYTIKLIASNNSTPACIDSIIIPIIINTYPACNANYSYNVGLNGTVTFTSTSAGTSSATIYYWHYGNAITYSTTGVTGIVNTHTYTANGVYSVSLTIVNSSPSCSSTVVYTINVNTVNGCNLIANYTYSYLNNTSISFSSSSTGTVAGSSYSWNYGDGATGTGLTSSHTYSSNGVYMAWLVVNNNSTPACTSSKTVAITINTLCNLTANYTHTVGSGGTVNFNSSSSVVSAQTKYYWNFGDGVYSTAPNPVHSYTNAGTYLVTLYLNDTLNVSCKDSLTQSLNVTGVACVANPAFTLLPTGTPKYWNAIPVNPWNVTAAVWSWGDGTVSNTLYTSHLYSLSATYSICLSVTVSCGSSSTYCYPYLIYKSTSGNPLDVLSINVVAPEISTGIDGLNTKEWSYSIYPNPNDGLFNINADDLQQGQKTQIQIRDITGALIYQSEHLAETIFEKTIDLSTVSNGLYFITIISNKKTLTQKIVVNK